MTQLTWGDTGSRYFEAGIDRGVLYIDDVGIPWNGLTSVQESPSGGEPTPYYMDGRKFRNLSSEEEYEASIQAITYPEEFEACDGSLQLASGFYINQQPRETFGFSYRTLVGNDVDGIDHAYKIHIVYDALASPTQVDYESLNEDLEPTPFSWAITTQPPVIANYRPSSHFTIDSRTVEPTTLAAIEDILYGTATEDARLPSALELITLMTIIYVRTNLALNPNTNTGLTPASTPISRTNHSINPSYKTLGSANVAGSTGVWSDTTTTLFDAGQTRPCRKYLMTVINSTSPISLAMQGAAASARYTTTPGEVWTASTYLLKDLGVDAVRTGRIDCNFYDGSGVLIGSMASGTALSMTNAIGVRPSLTITAPALAAAVQFSATISGSGGSLGAGILLYGDIVVEKEDTLYGVLVGTYSQDQSLSGKWSGTADASSTQGYAMGLPATTTADQVSKSDSIATAITSNNGWSWIRKTVSPTVAHDGNFAGVIVPTGTSNQTYCDIYGSSSALVLLPGRTYKASIWFRRRGPVRTYKALSWNSLRSRLILFYKNPGLETFTSVNSNGGPTDVGEALSEVTVAIPSGSAGGFLRLYNGSANPSDPLWFDSFMVEDITDFDPPLETFFDGSTADAPLVVNAWTGIADQSTSTQTVYYP